MAARCPTRDPTRPETLAALESSHPVDHEQAIAESKRALELDPLSPIINAWLGWRYYFARQFDQAISIIVR